MIEPLLFEPYLRPQIWGGRALERYGKSLPTADRYGESWEVSAHPHHASVIREGSFKGRTLADLVSTHPSEIFGDQIPSSGEFPLLIKLLDCADLLSVQVHPDDQTAKRLLGEDRGKTEAWVVLEAAPSAKIYAGLKEGVDQKQFEQHVAAKTTDQCLHQIQPRAGDCIHIPAGTVHTMGGGVIIAEVQQSSDATFRLFDWNRVGPDGQPRALHIEQSLASIDYTRGPVQPTRSTRLRDKHGSAFDRLVENDYFRIDRYEVVGVLPNPHEGRMSLWMVLGQKVHLAGEKASRDLAPYETFLIPAASPRVVLKVNPSQTASLLCISLPAQSLR